jgi:predicted 3-demethylubiquinone-9 3-methyltransferase (glyoxalase superfamily)
MQAITPFLWFDDNLEDAIRFYTSVFGAVTVVSENRMPDGQLFMGEFEIAGQRFRGLNGGPMFRFTEAISFFVDCDDQAEVDRLWIALTDDGGEESQCGWLRDKFGLSWQIIPVGFGHLMSSGTPDQSQRVMAAMMQMRKLDLAVLEKAFHGAD